MNHFIRCRALWLPLFMVIVLVAGGTRAYAIAGERLDTLYAEVADTDANGFTTLRESPSETSAELGRLSNGTLLAIEFEDGDWAAVHTGECLGYLQLKDTRPVLDFYRTTEPSYLERMGVVLGYADVVLPGGMQETPLYAFADDSSDIYAYAPEGEILRLVRDLGEWSQIQFRYTYVGFIRSELLQPFLIPAFSNDQSTMELGNGTYKVGQTLPPDIYSFCAAGKGMASIEITVGNDAYTRRYEAEGASFYNFYLPEGASIVIKGEGLLADMRRDFLWFVSDSGTEFTGSGRFLLNVNLDGALQVDLAPGEMEGYYAISTILDEDGPAPELTPVLPGQVYTVYLPQGSFIEIRNCHIETNG